MANQLICRATAVAVAAVIGAGVQRLNHPDQGRPARVPGSRGTGRGARMSYLDGSGSLQSTLGLAPM